MGQMDGSAVIRTSFAAVSDVSAIQLGPIGSRSGLATNYALGHGIGAIPRPYPGYDRIT